MWMRSRTTPASIALQGVAGVWHQGARRSRKPAGYTECAQSARGADIRSCHCRRRDVAGAQSVGGEGMILQRGLGFARPGRVRPGRGGCRRSGRTGRGSAPPDLRTLRASAWGIIGGFPGRRGLRQCEAEPAGLRLVRDAGGQSRVCRSGCGCPDLIPDRAAGRTPRSRAHGWNRPAGCPDPSGRCGPAVTRRAFI